MGDFKKSGGVRSNKPGQGFNRRGSFDRPRFSGKGGFSRSGDRGGRDGPRPQMFSAVCSECNRACEIPFRPSGERPVFCKDCFSNKRGSSPGGYPRREVPARNFPQRDFISALPPKPQTEDKRIDELKRQLDAVNKKLDIMLKIIEGIATHKVKAKKSGTVNK